MHAGAAEVHLPPLGPDQDPSGLIPAYQQGVLTKTTRLADIRGRLELQAPTGVRSVQQEQKLGQ